MRATATRWAKRGGAVALASVLAVLGVGAWMVASTAKATHASLEDVPARDIAIVPGAMVFSSGVPSHVLEDRLRCAEDAYRSGRVRRILVTGDHGSPTYDETDAMRRWLVGRGIPEADVIGDHAGFRTLDSMHRAASVFGVKDAVVCTQAFHLPRALFLARSFGIDAVGVVADRRTYRGAAWNALRETIARPVALFDVKVLHRGARLLGPKLPGV